MRLILKGFRVLSEAERTAALYSLLQHSTPVQIRFFLSVLQHMAQSDPMSALLANNTAAAKASTEDRNKLKQNRISAPGTLFPHERWQGQLDQVSEGTRAIVVATCLDTMTMMGNLSKADSSLDVPLRSTGPAAPSLTSTVSAG
jgi:hypothetical protein